MIIARAMLLTRALPAVVFVLAPCQIASAVGAVPPRTHDLIVIEAVEAERAGGARGVAGAHATFRGPSGFTILRIAETGDEPPGREGAAFGELRWPTINALGDVVFQGRYMNVSSGNEGVYRFRANTLERVIDDGFDFSPPDQSGASSYTGFGPPIANDLGHIGFQAGFSFGDGNQGLYTSQGGVIKRVFDNNPLGAVPGRPDAVWSLFPFTAGFYGLHSDSGHAATIARYRDPSFNEHEGVYVGSPGGDLRVAADEATTPPGQSPGAAFTNFDTFMALTGDGHVVFGADYENGAGQSGVYRFDPDTQVLARIADGSMRPPGQPAEARFVSFDIFPSVNDTGMAAFGADYVLGIGSSGIFVGDGMGVISSIVDNSGAFDVPGHPGKSFTLFGPPVMNAAGDVAFVAEFGAGPDDVGVFLCSNGEILKVFDLADAVPGQPAASFTHVGGIAINAAAELAFTARYTGGIGNEGVYLWSGSGLALVLDESQDLFGRAPTNLDIMLGTGGSGGQDGKARGMNDAGQIVFGAAFANGDTGVYLAAPPLTCGIDTGIETVLISHPGNPPDTNGRGSVFGEFHIGTFEVTNAQYVEFLNAIAADDPNGVYHEVMTTSLRGGVNRSGVPGSYTYTVKPNFGNKPASGFDWADAARFCNWLHNNKPAGPQGPSTTEDGAYDLALPLADITRAPGARWHLPSHDEWYKAAYYDPFDPGADAAGTPDYWAYPTRSDVPPAQAHSDAFGDVVNPGPNTANYERGVDWNGTDCTDPEVPCGNVSTVGSAGATSPWGAFDMGGNIYEWTDTPGRPILLDPVLPTRVARGGDFSNELVLLSRNLDIDVNMQSGAANFGMRVVRAVCERVPCNAVDLAEPFGELNAGDIDAYVGVFLSQNTSIADLTGDGVLNVDDIEVFVILFLGGCP